MNRYLATSLLATTTGAVLVFVAHGCTLNPFAGYSFEEAQAELVGASASSSGGTGGSGGAAGSGGAGGCTCTDDGNPCTDDAVGQKCPGGDANSCHTVVPTHQCSIGSDSGYCDNAGTCKPCAECMDAECEKRCAGQCEADNVCTSGKCVDGYCCDSDCTGPCKACNRVEGMCVALPVGMAGECAMGQLCSNVASCKETTKKPLGELCAKMDSACESGTCPAQICVSPNGQPCVENLECASRLCDATTHTCVACGGSVMCPAGASCLPGGQCQVFPGQPAANSSECAQGGMVNDGLTCSLPVGAVCKTNSECIYHDCNGAPNGTCAGFCAIDAECPMGTTCNANGQCRLPKGSFCVIDDHCQGPIDVGTCSGFPRRCQ